MQSCISMYYLQVSVIHRMYPAVIEIAFFMPPGEVYD
jgi:hypothetical protein